MTRVAPDLRAARVAVFPGVLMLVLLPPSETKRPGGAGVPLDLDRLVLPSLRTPRERVIDALVGLSRDEDAAARVLKLSVKRRHEIGDNARIRTAPTLPAIDRYTGVLFDALDAPALDEAARSWLGQHVWIHSAPFGPVGALDDIPPYRLAAGTSLPGLPPLRRVWAEAVTEAMAEAAPPFVLDLRSEAYAALGPVPPAIDSVYVRIVTAGEDGAVRALNHFNKHTKGELVRALSETRPEVRGIRDLHEWADAMGWTLGDTAEGEVAVVV